MNASEPHYFQLVCGDGPAGTGAGNLPAVGKDDNRCQAFANTGRGGKPRDLPDVVLDEKWVLLQHCTALFTQSIAKHGATAQIQTALRLQSNTYSTSGSTTGWHLSADCTIITWSYCHARGCPKRDCRHTVSLSCPLFAAHFHCRAMPSRRVFSIVPDRCPGADTSGRNALTLMPRCFVEESE